jgi:hypothetical protein
VKTVVALALSVLALGSLTAPAAATPSPPPSSQQDSVMGSALVDVSLPFYGTGITINATSDASGANAKGSVSVNINAVYCCTTRNYELAGPVTSLHVSGNQATIGFCGPIQDRAFTGLSRNVGFVTVTDNGPTGDVVDYSAVSVYIDPSQPLPETCPSSPSGSSFDLHWVIPATSPLPQWAQDFVVHDAPDHPTSKDQCKDGGWKSFAFQNQGQCVAFVERGPKT